MRSSWFKANNEAVSNLTSASDLAQLSQTLDQLVTDLQSLPVPAMLTDMELTVSFNLLTISWTSSNTSLLNTIHSTLTRVISHHIPDLVLPVQIKLQPLLSHFLSTRLLGQLSSSSLETVMDIVSLLVMSLTSDLFLCQEYLAWSDKLERYLVDIHSTLLVTAVDKTSDGELLKMNIINPSNTGKAVTTSCAPVLRKVVEIVTNNVSDKPSSSLDIDHQFLPKLFSVAMNLKQGNKSRLGSCIDNMVASSSMASQPEMVTRLGLLLRGEFLLEEGRVQGALSSFGEAIKGDGENVRAYLGVAKCFEKMGRFNNELEIWNIISSILQKNREGSEGICPLDFVERIIRILFPCRHIGLVQSLVTWARKCFKMEEYSDSADKFLDAISLASAGDASQEDSIDMVIVKQEAALALLIVGNVSESQLLCQDLSIARKSGGKRKKHDGRQNEVVLKYLLAKCHFINGDLDASLLYLDQSLRCCLADMADISRVKMMKSESVEEEGNIDSDMLSVMVRLRARLHFEKALVYRALNDKKSFKMSLSSAIKVDPNYDFANYFLDFLEAENSKAEFEALKGSMKKFPTRDLGAEDSLNDVGLKFILDSSTIHLICQQIDVD